MQTVRDCLLISNWGESTVSTLYIQSIDTVSNAETNQRQFSLSVVRDVDADSQILLQSFRLSAKIVTLKDTESIQENFPKNKGKLS